MSEPLSEFLVISRGKWDDGASKEEIEAAIGRFYEWIDRQIEAGCMKAGSRLKREGVLVSKQGIVTDAPLAETKEVIGGYWFIVAASLREAAELAARNPCLPYGIYFEIRPLEPEKASAYALTNETSEDSRKGAASVVKAGYHFIPPDDLHWRPSNLMRIPNADYLERTGSENLSARLWRLPPKSASTLHKHIRQEEFYFVMEGTGRMRAGGETLTVPKYGGVLVGPETLRQVFNDTDEDALWLIVGAPEELELLQGSKSTGMDLSLIYPTDPTQLPPELAGAEWPPL